MIDSEYVQISDIKDKPVGASVTFSGMVIDKVKARKDLLIVTIKDFSGTIKVHVCLSSILTQSLFWKQTILQITGQVSISNNVNKIIENICNVQVFSKNEKNDVSLSELDVSIKKKASLILMSSICRSVSTYFLNHGFVEFDSRVISRNWQMDGLETLNVLYPGFGSPTTLITSPSPQIIDFLKIAMMSRAFTESISFSTTFRFKDGATETRVLMAKALDFTESDLYKSILEIAKNVLSEFGEGCFIYPKLETDINHGTWPNCKLSKNRHTIDLVVYETYLESMTEDYASKIEKVIHIIDVENNILAEGARELMRNGLSVSTITVYPSQFLSLLKKAPARQLQELWRKHGW